MENGIIQNRIKGLVRSGYRYAKTQLYPMFRLFVNEVTNWSRGSELSFERRVWLLRRGFRSSDWLKYDTEPQHLDLYLSWTDKIVAERINQPWDEILANKYLFYRLLGQHQDRIPDLYAVIHDERITPVEVDIDRNANPGDWVLEQLAQEDRLVLKPVKGSAGNDILFFERSGQEGEIIVNGEAVSTDKATQFIDELDDYLVTAYLDQVEWLKEINSTSLNTMRVLTMWDDEIDEPFIPSAILRIGSEKSQQVDNFSRGGLSAHIDIDSGELGSAARLDSGELVFHDKHPDTGQQIAGRTIEEWDDVRKTVLELMKSHPMIRYAGWDIALSSDGEVKIIEGNSNSDVDLLQIHEPLLANDRAREFYKRHVIV